MPVKQDNNETVVKISQVLKKSRKASGKTQDYIAKKLGVSKKTIQNWEKGITCPDLIQWEMWFKSLGQNPLPYYLSVQYPWLNEDITDINDDSKIEDDLAQLIHTMPTIEKKELLFLMSGLHGSSWYSLLQMFTAHCHTTMQSRVAAARIILENYEMESRTGEIVCKGQIMPDTRMLRHAINQGKQAAQNNQNRYTTEQDGGALFIEQEI